ncbi:blast:Zinc finger protein 142 [Drosophila guanche]|nr:blast:Zinc finger protein 142 [Drosophila guanche]
MCISCIAEFQRLLQFKCSCLEAHEQYAEHQQTPGIKIKNELEIQAEEKFCGFIYLDSDEEVSDEDGSRRVFAAFDIQHVPIKEEHMARVPTQQSDIKFVPPQPQPLLPLVGVKTEAEHELKFKSSPKEEELDVGGISNKSGSNANNISFESESNPNAISYEIENDNDNESDEEEVLKFTYDDDEDAMIIPQPMQSTSTLCKICFQEIPNQLYQTHMERMHLSKDWECHLCGKKFLNCKESRLKLHMKWHKLQRRLKCPICGFFCNSKETLKDHKRAVHSRTVCQYCGKVMKPNILQSHMKKHLDEREAELAQKLASAEPLGASASDQMLMPVKDFGPFYSGESKLKVVNHLRPPSTSSAVQKLTHLDQPETASAAQKRASMQTQVPLSPLSFKNNKEISATSSPIQQHREFPVPISPVLLNNPVQQQKLHSPVKQQQMLQSPVKQQLHSPHQQQKEQQKPEDTPVTYSPVMPICVIQCAFCSEKFKKPQQLQDHVLSKHKDINSPPTKIKPPQKLQLQPLPTAINMDMDTDQTSFESASTTSNQVSSTMDVSQNSSSASCNSSINNSYNKSYCKCHICGKAFDLKIKLNRHLKQHNKAPF